MKRHALTFAIAAVLAAAAQSPAPPPAPAASSREPTALSRVFWAGVATLGMVFRSVGVLSGSVERGEVWVVELRSGQRRRLGTSGDLAWPVQAPDGTAVYALRGRDLVRLDPSGAAEPVPSGAAEWRKLIGVGPDGAVLGFVAGSPRAHPAMLSPAGRLAVLPQPESVEERRQVSQLLQENRAYGDGTELLVQRSARGGQGFDVVLVARGERSNLSDCGDDVCGQPSFSPDRQRVFYVVRAARH